MELRVGHKFRLGRKIGSGSFGDIYIGAFRPAALVVCVWCVAHNAANTRKCIEGNSVNEGEGVEQTLARCIDGGCGDGEACVCMQPRGANQLCLLRQWAIRGRLMQSCRLRGTSEGWLMSFEDRYLLNRDDKTPPR